MKRENPTIVINSKSPQGNIYHILGLVSVELRHQSRIIEYNDLRDQVLNCTSYEEAIKIIREHVNLIDLDCMI